MLNKTETFHKVLNHLLDQGGAAVSEWGCAYRGEGGTSCAVGCLITDDEYAAFPDVMKDVEGKTAAHLIERVAKGTFEIAALTFDTAEERCSASSFFNELQSLHDNSHDVKTSRWIADKFIKTAQWLAGVNNIVIDNDLNARLDELERRDEIKS